MKKNALFRRAAFSLVEVTLALGVAAFCLIALLALLPAGASSNNNTSEETVAANALANMVADLKNTPASATQSPLYGIPIPVASGTTVFFDGAWKPVPSAPAARYRLTTTGTAAATPGLVRMTLQVTWPAVPSPGNAAGSLIAFAAFRRE